MESGNMEFGKVEPGNVEPGSVESGKMEPGRAEPGSVESELSDVYVAGLFDGEGYMGIKNFKGKTYLRYRLAIANQHKGVLELIKNRFGGNIYKKDNKIECWQWEINNKQEAINFLEKIIPHLIVKKEKSEEGLKLIFNTKGYDKSR